MGSTVNRYETSVPRAACGIAAVAMTAISIGIAVMPAQMKTDSHEPPTAVASKVVPPTVTGVITDFGSINVVAVRRANLSAITCVSPHRKLNPDSRVRRSLSCSHSAR